MTALLLVGIVLALLILRQPLLVILMSVAAYIHIVWGQAKLDYIIEDMWVGLDKEVILSIPLFILCGNVMTRGSIAQRLINILASITRPLPGGMAVACVLSCAVFAAISGSSIVTMLAIGSIMYPAMRQAGYNLNFTLGAIMSGGTLGIIIPPSIPMII
jgi:C4-dicarboxylate transporter DctM subunit